MKGIRSIEVSFAVPVEMTNQDQQELVTLLGRICDRYQVEHPDRVMWPFGIGSKMLVNPLMLSDDEPIPFDDAVFSVECAEQENPDWPCAKCKFTQRDHGHFMQFPAAGACEYQAASKLQGEPAKGSA